LHPHRLTQEDKKSIVAALQSGAEPKDLAAKYGVGSSHIGNVYKQETGALWRTPAHLSQSDKDKIVADIQANTASIHQLAKQYGVSRLRINAALQESAAVQESQYRAWNKEEKKMYAALGIDWFNQKVLISSADVIRWLPLKRFMLMQKTGLKGISHTPEQLESREIYEGDIIQFSITDNGKETVVKDTVAYDLELAGFIVTELNDPLIIYSGNCEIIGNIYETPDLLNETETTSESLSPALG
jgi:transposase-like protein